MVNLALVGVGKWGQNFLKIASSLENCKVKYVFSKSQKTLKSLSDEYIKTTSLNDLIDSNADGIIIATPPSTHYEISKKFLNHNFNLLIEKPLATNFKQAIELQKIWRTKRTKVLVGHTYLYNPAFLKCKQLLRKFGKIDLISFEGLLSPKRDDVSVLWDWGPHPISMMLDIIKKPVKNIKLIYAHKRFTKLDTLKVELIFEGDIKGLIHLSWYGSKKIRRITIKGSSRKLILDDTNQENQKISFYNLTRIPIHPIYNLENPLTNELKKFIFSIKNNKEIVSDINLGVSVVKVLSEIERLLNLTR